jgi:hypothetical protein
VHDLPEANLPLHLWWWKHQSVDAYSIGVEHLAQQDQNSGSTLWCLLKGGIPRVDSEATMITSSISIIDGSVF